ncbi:DUF6970 domain-containing protein [Hymenobacter weizhouensis]|uniref:DUF6970 domain-containing protein n=1 Tax=Hymenobacter sp. YIM 151500-1 TaxID=2987689 RepID=UPI002226D077|nr:hypothetical protein [Hymenobacter sp. YIM 151500-1]UYZ62835.1 hypothetical protein OIS53_17780 [Hymenobacter sp. YIM 151500-1]
MSRLLSWILLLLLGTVAGCNVASEEATPNCPSDFSATLIEQLKQQPKQNPPAEVTQYTYQGRTVYLVTGGCCDNYNYLFDTCGNVLCAASGGVSGRGDGRCPNFSATATNPVLIWRDPR